MAEQVMYKAKVACRIGGAYRRAGEVFLLPEFEVTPPFLERVESKKAPEPESAAAPSGRPKRQKAQPAPPGPMPSDLPGVVRD